MQQKDAMWPQWKLGDRVQCHELKEDLWLQLSPAWELQDHIFSPTLLFQNSTGSRTVTFSFSNYICNMPKICLDKKLKVSHEGSVSPAWELQDPNLSPTLFFQNSTRSRTVTFSFSNYICNMPQICLDKNWKYPMKVPCHLHESCKTIFCRLLYSSRIQQEAELLYLASPTTASVV